MNSVLVTNSIRFILLLIAQVAIFNNINLFGFINPFPYVLFIIIYPVNTPKYSLLLSSFALGILMDMFCNSGGIHTTSCIIIAYFRPSFLKFSFGISYEYQTIRINEKLNLERFSFLLTIILTHHTVLFLLEIFRFNLMTDILLRIFLTTVFTTVLCVIVIYLFKPAKR